MIYLTTEQVLFIHDRIIEEIGGEHGVRDLNSLESALGRPRAGFGATEFYPDRMMKAAVLMDGIIRNHPFVDGNKRTGIAAAVLFLRINGYEVSATNQVLESFTQHVTTQKPEISELAHWFRQHGATIRSEKK
ncbi:MAG: type II toxin-antitoxin system death-on-curing family toxin [Nitrospiraceae bacterium]